MSAPTSRPGDITIELGERSYPIRIGEGLLDLPATWSDAPASDQALVVTNTTVAPRAGSEKAMHGAASSAARKASGHQPARAGEQQQRAQREGATVFFAFFKKQIEHRGDAEKHAGDEEQVGIFDGQRPGGL